MTHAPDATLVTFPQRRRESRWIQKILLFATVVLLVDALFGDGGVRETLRASERYSAAVRELNTIREENAALRTHAVRLTRDPRTIEMEARGQLGLLRPGELLVIVKTR